MEPCMEALGKQSVKDFCVLIVDNGSKDGSIEWMEENLTGMIQVPKGGHLPESAENSLYGFPIFLLPLPVNTGFSGAVNLGIRMSVTEYVILLNNDTEVHEDYEREMEKAIERSPKVFSVSSKMIKMFDHDRVDDAGDLYSIVGWGIQRGLDHSSKGYNRPCQIFSACAGAAIYRRKIFHEIGLFDELHFAYLEDIDVGYRAKIAGYQNWYCPTALVYHYGSGTSGSQHNSFKVHLAARNNMYLIYKNMPLLQLLINAIPLAAGFAIKTKYFTDIGYGADYKRGLKEGFRTLYKCHRVRFEMKHLPYYLQIEAELIVNFFIYFYEYTKRHLNDRKTAR